MIVEAGKFDKEKKEKKLLEQEKNLQMEKIVRQQEQQEKTRKIEETDTQLFHLKEALENHQVDDATLQKIEKISDDNTIDPEEMKEILSMIEDLHEDESQKKYIPDDLRVTIDEYVLALSEPQQRKKTLIKLDTVLGILVQYISPGSGRGINLVGGLTLLLDKNLIVVQETHIDIKRSLQKKDGKIQQ